MLIREKYLVKIRGFYYNKVHRYDIHGKNILKTLNKYYSNDLGIKQINLFDFLMSDTF